MTREEARHILDNLKPTNTKSSFDAYVVGKAITMAIEALEQEPCEDMTIAYLMGYYADKEPCEDAVSRDELLKAIDTWDKFGVDDTNSLFRLDNLSLPHYVPYIHYDDVIKCIKGMPSVNPQPCDDAVSRQAVLKILDEYGHLFEKPREAEIPLDYMADMVSNLPNVQPRQKGGANDNQRTV